MIHDLTTDGSAHGISIKGPGCYPQRIGPAPWSIV